MTFSVRLDTAAHFCNLSTYEAEEGGLEFWVHLVLHSQHKDNLGYIARTCLKRIIRGGSASNPSLGRPKQDQELKVIIPQPPLS